MVEINLQTTCSKAGTTQTEAVTLLRRLDKEGIAEFEHDQHDTRITFLVPREDDTTINPLVPYIKLQMSSKKEKIEQVLHYVSNNSKCKSEQLLQYFGEKDTRPCGICSVCKSSEEKLDREGMKRIYFQIVGLLEEKEHSSREMTARLDFPEAHILQVLKLLVEKGALTTTASNKYKLSHL
jgi:ATP-dependent DNA helicase RecQ